MSITFMKNRVIAIILSAGKGKRMGSDIPKQYLEIAGKPLLYYCLAAFEQSCADDIIIVCSEGYEDYIRKEIIEKYGFSKVRNIASGGDERYDSVLSGLKAAVKISEDDSDIVLIHDGARPFITADNISAVVQAARKYAAAIAAAPVKDTIKISDESGFVKSTTKRSCTWQIQTPQGFRLGLIQEAYDILLKSRNFEGITDDAMVLEKAFPDIRIKLVDTSAANFKVTTPVDLELARTLLEK